MKTYLPIIFFLCILAFQVDTNAQTVERLDSIVYTSTWNGQSTPLYRAYFDYNSSGFNISSKFFEYFENAATWEKTDRSDYTYNQQNQIESIIYWEPDFQNMWQMYGREDYTYHPCGKPESIIDFDYTGTNWEAQFKDVYELDASDRLSATYFLEWDPGANQWDSAYKTVLTYHVNGMDYTEEWYEFQSQWILNWRDEVTFYALEKIATSKSFEYDNNSMTFTLMDSTVNTYDAQGQLLCSFELFGGAGAWTGQKHTYNYESNGDLKRSIDLDWDQSTTSWDSTEQTLFMYDRPNSSSTKTFYYFDSASGWETSYKQEYLYDLTRTIADLRLPAFYLEEEDIINDFYLGQLLEDVGSSFNNSTSSFDPSHETIYHYSPSVGVSLDPTQQTRLAIYPNPTTEVFRLQTSSPLPGMVSIHDMSGRQVSLQMAHSGEDISIAHFPAGTYVVKFQQEGKVYTGKVRKR